MKKGGMNKLTEYFYEEMDCFQVCELVIISINADAKVETGITAVDDFIIAELDGFSKG